MPGLRAALTSENPANPFSLNTEFKINVMDDPGFIAMRDQMRASNKDVPLDNEMIVFEGCEVDDKVVLGGKQPFLQHFCTFFNFNICHA